MQSCCVPISGTWVMSTFCELASNKTPLLLFDTLQKQELSDPIHQTFTQLLKNR